MRAVDTVTRAVYVLSGVVFLVLGTGVILLGTGVLPAWVHDRIFEMGRSDPFTMHQIQELGTVWVLAGLVFLWFARHYDRSAGFHWLATFYWLLDAWVHWFNAWGVFEHEWRAVWNAIPFALFLLLGLLRRQHQVPRLETTASSA
jgi:hypothetical protein